MVARRFDSTFAMTPKLRERIDDWFINPPKSQFQMYGPLNAYFHERFPGKLVKPQALLRERVPDAKLEELNLEPGAIVVENEIPSAVTQDSTGEWVYTRRSNQKVYPDFVICSYYGPDKEGNRRSDIIRFVVEVGSLGLQLNANTPRDKERIISQTVAYMALLRTEEGGDDKAVGAAILGDEVRFIEFVPSKGGKHLPRWRPVSTWCKLWGTKWAEKVAVVAGKD
ncbi:hypothetical protein FA95DRAFT_1558948 [Auriscalpium vulgare]|uniref:Uncharacterized protein n=1 Tax=Auriscalpium vulgare TaxID=40419 RepID=A0ACB8RUY4_9AGAM|nr:hypothetical protein FA95DRAFT_1558948 [Auriscalpium vulgare]